MAINVSVTNITSTTATVVISNMNSYYTDKQITLSINGDSSTFEATVGTYYQYDLARLSSNTTYTVIVAVRYWVPGDGWNSDGFDTATFTTDGEQIYPTYTAYASGNQIIFNVFDGSGYYLRYFTRLSGESATTDDSGKITQTSYITPPLEYSTQYAVNVGYSTSPIESDGVEWIGTSYITTDSAPVGDGGYVYIFTGSIWRRAKPYIFTGSRWAPASVYIFTGSRWQKTTS